MATADKPLIAISVIGHVDSGKSTLTGRLAFELGAVDGRQHEKLEKIAEANNKSSFLYAYVTDKTEQERKRGVTIVTSLVQMETEKFRINFLDCPGHADYIKNASNGCKQSDLSIVVVPADFQASCSSEGTLKTHLSMAAILGSKNFIVCINKLDEVAEKNASSMETIFDAASAAVQKILKRLGVKKESVFYLPISALKCIGLTRKSEKFPFFKGIVPAVPKEGFEKIMSLEEAIDYQDAPLRPVTRSLRLPISNIAHVPGHGAIFCGRLDYGTLKKKDAIRILPVGLEGEVKNLQAHKADIDLAQAGDNIGFNVICKDKQIIEKVKTGNMVGPASDDDFKTFPFYLASCISVKESSKGKSDERGIKRGYTPVISCGTSNVACKFARLISASKDGIETEDPDMVVSGARFKALLYPTKPMVAEDVTVYPAAGKFVCRDSGRLVVCGQIVGRMTEEEALEKFGVSIADLSGPKTEVKAGKKK